MDISMSVSLASEIKHFQSSLFVQLMMNVRGVQVVADTHSPFWHRGGGGVLRTEKLQLEP